MISIQLSGALVEGEGKGVFFTQIPWVKGAFTQILGFEPFPGTVNIWVGGDPRSGKALQDISKARGIPVLPPEDTDFCPARCFYARLSSAIPAGLVIPEVDDYYKDTLELLAPLNVRDALGVSEGDRIEVEIELESDLDLSDSKMRGS